MNGKGIDWICLRCGEAHRNMTAIMCYRCKWNRPARVNGMMNDQ